MYKIQLVKEQGEKDGKKFCVRKRDVLCAGTTEGSKMLGSISPTFEGIS